jgi:DNA repair exonuclease SbcCD ATPase subunit
MKVTKLTIHNIGKIGDTVVKLDKPLILFYGEIRQGKTTILNAVRWVCGGEFPSDIITHGKDEAHIELEFDGGMISRSFYKSKETKETKARPVVFVRNGKPVSSPVSEIKRFLNPFLIDQDHLRNKTELERKQFFAELFAVDTTELDKEWFTNDRDASNLRIAIKSYGEIDVEPVEPVDAEAAKMKLRQISQQHSDNLKDHAKQCQTIRDEHDEEVAKIRSANIEVQRHNSLRLQRQTRWDELTSEIAELQRKLAAAKDSLQSITEWLKENQAKGESPLPAMKRMPETPDAPDTSALEKQIQDAGATNVRAEQYRANRKRADEKTAKENQLSKLEARQREIKKEKQAKLKQVSDSCGINGLSFDDAGNFIYQDTQAGMLSTSQIMQLSSELSALYPEGFGLELLDRGESLGKSIFEFVERAKAEKKSILATIVGEHPAKVPKDVGVFVVDDGKVEEQELGIIP